MSIYATTWVVDNLTGEAKLVKHLNKVRIDRSTWKRSAKGWNKSGKQARIRKQSNLHNKKSRIASKKIESDNP